MNWIYRNDTDSVIIYRSETWLPGVSREVSYPVPPELGLTCIQEGDSPDPVLFHSDITVQPGAQEVISIPAPKLSHAVALSIFCMTADSGCECRFNSTHNCIIPIDIRGFQQTTSWENCSRIFFNNPTDNEVVISVTAIEAV